MDKTKTGRYSFLMCSWANEYPKQIILIILASMNCSAIIFFPGLIVEASQLPAVPDTEEIYGDP